MRIDQLDREQKDPNVITYPKIIHFGLRPAQLSYAGDPKSVDIVSTLAAFLHILHFLNSGNFNIYLCLKVYTYCK